MNLEILSNDELLRVVSPDTELEVLLFRRLSEALDEIIDLEDQVPSCGPDAISQDHECECEAQDERIAYLEEILDEHEIKYNK
jgi:hypothetical protein